jgi:putative FmdB family regulatory protein
MPIYAYRCQDCGHAVEVLQKISDAPLAECPACQRPSLLKQVTAAGFQLKGSGWYATDFKDNGTKPKVAKGEVASSSAEAKPDCTKAADSPPGTAKATEAAPAAAPNPPPSPAPASGPSPASS